MITTDDIDGFFAKPEELNREDYIVCDYFFETTLEPRLAAAQLCSEQSTAQWKRAGVQEDLRVKFGAKTIFLEVVEQSSAATYPMPWTQGDVFYRCRAQIAHPCLNFGSSISLLLSGVAGEGAFYCPGITTLKLMDIDFPASYLDLFPGPQFGLKGLREKLKVEGRPFFIGVVKPNIGLSIEEFAEQAYQSWLGGLDIAKDDEMLGNVSWSPLSDRTKAASQKCHQAAEETQKPKAMMANITDDVSQLLTRYQEVEANGASMILINSFFTGLSSIRLVRDQASIPIMGHFTGQALYDRMTHYGIEGVPLVKIQRLLGCDMIGLPGFGDRMHNSDQTVLNNIKACLDPMGSIKPALPIPGGSDSAKTLASVYNKIGHTDFGFISGRGVFAYPGGPKAGAASLHEAWKKVEVK